MAIYHVGIPLPLGLSREVCYPIYDKLGTLQAYVKNPDLVDKIVSLLNGDLEDSEDLDYDQELLKEEISELENEKTNLEMTIDSLTKQLVELRKEKEELT